MTLDNNIWHATVTLNERQLHEMHFINANLYNHGGFNCRPTHNLTKYLYSFKYVFDSDNAVCSYTVTSYWQTRVTTWRSPMGLYSHFEHNILYTYKNKYTPRYICLQYAEFHSDGIMYYIYSYNLNLHTSTQTFTHT